MRPENITIFKAVFTMLENLKGRYPVYEVGPLLLGHTVYSRDCGHG